MKVFLLVERLSENIIWIFIDDEEEPEPVSDWRQVAKLSPIINSVQGCLATPSVFGQIGERLQGMQSIFSI